LFDSGLKKADVEQALGTNFAGTIPNNYRLVREAIDRGVPLDEVKAGNNISTQLKKLILPQIARSAGAVPRLVGKLGFVSAKSA
jgi:pilus assembly protein CpaE